jgi:hypothetical protein
MSEPEAEAIWGGYVRDAYAVLGRGLTTGSQLDKYNKTMFGHMYHGTHAADAAPTLTKERPYSIINTETLAQGGEHWVALCLSTDGSYIVFDSFGRDIKSLIPSLYSHANASGFELKQTDDDADQRTEELDCGARCCAWIRLFNDYGEATAMLI